MKRELYVSTPSVHQLNITAPVNKGGTGGTTSAEVAVSLGGVLTASIGHANGPVKQEVGGGVAVSALPSAVPTGATIDGPQDIFVGITYSNLTITNYDANTTYAVSVSAGSVSINGNTITFTAPAIPQVVTMNIGNRQVQLNVVGLAPNRPNILVPAYNSVNQAITGLQLTADALSLPSGTPSHQQSDWQLATDSTFNNIVQQSLNDTVNKTSWVVTGLSVATTYYARVRYKDTNLGYSNWSNSDKFTTKATFVPVNEEAKLTASDKLINANFGISVAISSDGTRVAVGASAASNGSITTGACYVFLRSNNSWVQEQKLLPSDPVASMGFGVSVGLSSDGSRLVTGANAATATGTASAGQAYVFLRTGTTWAQEAILAASDKAASANFGGSSTMSFDGTRVAIGASGATSGGTTSAGQVYVFLRTGTTWVQEQILIASDKASGNQLGRSVSISADGTRVVTGAHTKTVSGATGAGQVYVFLRTGTTWVQEQILTASDSAASFIFGYTVRISADATRLAVGAYGATGGSTGAIANAGACYVFLRTGTTWAQEAKLIANDGTAANQFGRGIGIIYDGSMISVGAANAPVNGLNGAGAAYIYTRNGTSWTQAAKSIASDGAGSDTFADNMAFSDNGSRTIMSAMASDPSGISNAGAVYVFS